MHSIQIRLYDLFRKDLNLPDDKALEFVQAIEQAHEETRESLATKEFVKDELHQLELKLIKTYLVFGIVQLLAILGGVLAVLKFAMGGL